MHKERLAVVGEHGWAQILFPVYTFVVLLHNGEFCNNCTPKRGLHISVHFQTNAL
jgi:hypothetical protein